MSDNRETRLLMISPRSKLTPDQLVRTIHAMNRDVRMKETCYGAVIEGEKFALKALTEEIRGKYPNEVYSKRRAYPAGDQRRCRAHHGTRPGYSQLEAEWDLLSNVQYGLECADRGEERVPLKAKEKLPILEFKRICEE
ncbi:MAG: DUF2102 domain-containing protein [Candidatus Methanomethylophilaceae archaeon]|jgi:putative methanogenesis marker protein 6